MIRKCRDTDIDAVAKIWLETNINSHDFIPAQYWNDHFEVVKGMLLQAELYVYEDLNKISGFIGLNKNYIEGIFVCENAQSKGIGRQLLEFSKALKMQLVLNVYKKNSRAVQFYQREQFKIAGEAIDENTNEAEYIMVWKKLTE